MVQKLKMIWKRILSYFPTKLPVGMTEFEAWAAEIMELSGKFADETSLKFAIATMVLHAESKYGSLPKNYFVVRLRKTAANQVAGQIFTDIKAKQEEAKKAAEAAQPKAEVTAASVGSGTNS